MSDSLSQIIKLYLFPCGRRAYSFAKIVEVARILDWPELVDRCLKWIEHENRVSAMQRILQSQRNNESSPELLTLDSAIDRTLGAIFRFSQEPVETLPGEPEALAGQTILDKAFPNGAAALTLLDYYEENHKVKDLLKLFEPRPDGAPEDDKESGSLSSEIATLALTRYVEVLRERNNRFGTLLNERQALEQEVTTDTVRAAFYKGQEHLLQAVAMIMGRYPDYTDEDIEARTKLLAPVMEQQSRIATYRKSRRRVRDIDPETGEEVPEEGENPTDPTDPEDIPTSG